MPKTARHATPCDLVVCDVGPEIMQNQSANNICWAQYNQNQIKILLEDSVFCLAHKAVESTKHSIGIIFRSLVCRDKASLLT